jgi:arsenate reductase (thioredoxin)
MASGDGSMRVGELARRAGVAPSAIRWYEAAGVLPAPARKASGYRQYAEGDLARLRLVVSLRRLGLTPLEAGRLASSCMEHGTATPALVEQLRAQRAAIEQQRADLDQLEAELTDLELTIEAADRAAEGRLGMTGRPIRVLFVCTGNSGRSQIAEALLTAFGGADFTARSAGTEPRQVSPFAIEALRNAGIDWAHARSKSVDEFAGESFDYVITVCDRARVSCPVFPGGGNVLHWGLDDPADVTGPDADKLAAYERTRRDLTLRLRPFVEIARRTAGRGRVASLAAE